MSRPINEQTWHRLTRAATRAARTGQGRPQGPPVPDKGVPDKGVPDKGVPDKGGHKGRP